MRLGVKDQVKQGPGRRSANMLLALAVLVVACTAGGEQEPAQEETSASSGEEEADPAADDPAATKGKPTLVVALDTDVDLLEPHTFRSIGAYVVTRLLYEPLLDQVFEERGGLLVGTDEFEGALAESYEITDDGTEVTFNLREDARFASGEPITASDVAYTFQRSIEGPGYIGALLPFIRVTSSDQIEVLDSHKLVIRPSEASPLLESFMAFQVFSPLDEDLAREHATDDDPWSFEWFNVNATPTGPYMLGEEFVSGSPIVLEPNPHYYDLDRLGNGGIRVQSVPAGDQRALLLQRGELDLATGIPPRLLPSLEDDPNVTVYAEDSSRTAYLGMNTNFPPLDDVRVRQAISYAIPYEALIEQVMHGYATHAGNVLTPQNDTFAGDELGSYETDLDRARGLLDEAGIDGFEMELAVRQSRAEEREVATFIQESLRQIGIDVDISVLPDAEYGGRLNAKELPMFLNDFVGWGEDPFYKMNFMLHSGEFTNFSQYSNPDLDELIEEGLFETDPERRAEISAEAQRITLEEAPLAYLYAPQWVVAARSDVTGVGKDLTEIVRLETLTRDQ